MDSSVQLRRSLRALSYSVKSYYLREVEAVPVGVKELLFLLLSGRVLGGVVVRALHATAASNSADSLLTTRSYILLLLVVDMLRLLAWSRDSCGLGSAAATMSLLSALAFVFSNQTNSINQPLMLLRTLCLRPRPKKTRGQKQGRPRTSKSRFHNATYIKFITS